MCIYCKKETASMLEHTGPKVYICGQCALLPPHLRPNHKQAELEKRRTLHG